VLNNIMLYDGVLPHLVLSLLLSCGCSPAFYLLTSSAEKVVAKSSLSNNHKNALNAVLFEAIDLVLHYHT
jgi:hypothetical protein